MICSRCGKAGHTSCLSTPPHVDHWTLRPRCQFCGSGHDILVIGYPPGVGQPMCGWCRTLATLPGVTELQVVPTGPVDVEVLRAMQLVYEFVSAELAAAVECAEAAARAPR